jgi:carbon-monoxide dehydrogenase small subunit
MTVVTMTVNGRKLSADVEPRTHLADFLREAHNLTGTHIGCEHGVCGACTLLVDGVPARSCITLAASCEGAEITTIEGLDHDEIATELREAFKREHALQCGYCTPGMMVSARDLVLRLESPDERGIRVAMSGNLCRCTGYVGIVRAVQSIVADRRARGIAAVADGGRKRLGPAGSGNAEATKETAVASDDRPKREFAGPAPSAPKSFRGDWKPQTSLRHNFEVAHPPDEVWNYFGRVAEVASCLPGVTLDGEPKNGHVEGCIRVKVGPISADFRGIAEVARDEATRTGEILGSGQDARSHSTTMGSVRYSVLPGASPGTTNVDLIIGYTLTGMLAQFGRGGLVQDVASRLIAAFAANLGARMSHSAHGAMSAPPPAVGEFNAGLLVFSVLIDRVKRFVSALLGRKGAEP